MLCRKCKKEMPEAPFCPWCGIKQALGKKYHKRANGTGTVYKLSGNRSKPWAAAKSGVLIGTYPTRKDALTALEKLSGKELSDQYNMTFAEVYEAWKVEHFRELTLKGQEGYTLSYKRLNALKQFKIKDLKTTQYQSEIDKQPKPSAEKSRQLIGQLCKWAMREEIITTNYAQFIKLPNAEPEAEKDIFTDNDIAIINNEAKINDTAKLVCMLLATGMRIGELFNLKTVDCFDKYCIGGEKTEAGKNRIIPIRPEGRAYFQYFLRRCGDAELLIDGFSGNKNVNNFRRREYYALLKSLGIDTKTPHATRHTYASRAVKEGMPREILQKILGHANYETTANIYVHADVEKLIESVEC